MSAEQTWRLVPVEPTQEMTEAGAGSIDDNGGNARWSDVREAWATMLEVAPTPPAPQAMPPVTLPELPERKRAMLCTKCGYQNPDTQAVASNAGAPCENSNCGYIAFVVERGYEEEDMRAYAITAIAGDRKLRGAA